MFICSYRDHIKLFVVLYFYLHLQDLCRKDDKLIIRVDLLTPIPTLAIHLYFTTLFICCGLSRSNLLFLVSKSFFFFFLVKHLVKEVNDHDGGGENVKTRQSSLLSSLWPSSAQGCSKY